MKELQAPDVSAAQTLSIDMRNIRFDVRRERDVVAEVMRGLDDGVGGWIVTPNVDIMRICAEDPAAAELVRQATLVVADGAPVIWASRLSRRPLPERVTGSALIFSISAALAPKGRSAYLIGGATGVPELAAVHLMRRYKGLQILGTDSPPFGFEHDRSAIADIVSRVKIADPDVVFVGLGFPKQERLIAELRQESPRTWFVGCGAAVPMAAGMVSRAPTWAQKSGLEWLHRLATEPRRLARRYLVCDLPFAIALLMEAAWYRLTTRPH